MSPLKLNNNANMSSRKWRECWENHCKSTSDLFAFFACWNIHRHDLGLHYSASQLNYKYYTFLDYDWLQKMYFPINRFLSCNQTVCNRTHRVNCTNHNVNKIIIATTSNCQKSRLKENGEFFEIAFPQQRRARTLCFLWQKYVLFESIDVIRLLLFCLIVFLGNCNIYEKFARGLLPVIILLVEQSLSRLAVVWLC